MRNRLIHLICCFVIVVSLAGALQSQTPPQRGRDGTQIDIDVVSVPLMVSVADSKGKMIANLKKEDFRVYEDDKLQTIRSFTRESDLPLSIALLVDSSGSVIDKLKFEQAAATDFFFNTIKRRKDRGMVVSFDSKAYVLTDDTVENGFSDEPERLSEAVKKIQAGGGTAVHDAIYHSVNLKLSKEQGDRRKLIILISDGEDTASRFSRTESLEMAQRHDVTIYAISTNKTSDTRSREKVQGDELLQVLADETGGKAYFPLKIDDLSADFQKIGDELRSQYVLSYTPTNANNDGTFRRIRVEMVNDKHKARTRKGYFASKK
jgi:Ca-activated chloride channel family protein